MSTGPQGRPLTPEQRVATILWCIHYPDRQEAELAIAAIIREAVAEERVVRAAIREAVQ